MASVSAANLIIHKGTYFEETFNILAEDGGGLNLNNSTVVAKIKKYPTATSSYPFSITLTVSDSSVKISMASTITSALPSGRCYYDVVLTSSTGIMTKIVEGNVLVQETASV